MSPPAWADCCQQPLAWFGPVTTWSSHCLSGTAPHVYTNPHPYFSHVEAAKDADCCAVVSLVRLCLQVWTPSAGVLYGMSFRMQRRDALWCSQHTGRMHCNHVLSDSRTCCNTPSCFAFGLRVGDGGERAAAAPRVAHGVVLVGVVHCRTVCCCMLWQSVNPALPLMHCCWLQYGRSRHPG